MQFNLTDNVKCTRINNAAAAATTDVTSSALYMAGWDRVTFMVPFGTITSGAVTSVKVQQSDDDGSTDAYSDLEGSSVTVPDTASNKVVFIEVVRPAKPYLKVIVDRGTQNAVVDGIFAFQHGAGATPFTQSTTLVTPEIHVTPAEGTA